MYIAIDKQTKKAYYKGDLEMREYLHGHDFIDTRMTPDNCELIPLTGDNNPQYWVGGGKLVYNDSTFDLTPEGESEVLFNLKKAKRQQIKDKRNEMLNGTVTVNLSGTEYTLDCDLVSRSSIHQAIDNGTNAGLPETDTVSWKLADNTYHDFTYAELKMIAIQMAMFIQAQYNIERDKSIEIDNATINTIGNINWE